MLIVGIACYLVLATAILLPFRISSAESRQEEEELREAKR